LQHRRSSSDLHCRRSNVVTASIAAHFQNPQGFLQPG
jgi:hypothetical protein